MTAFISAYRHLLQSGELVQRVVEANQHLAICDVCAWGCPVDRTAGQVGVCRTGMRARVSSYGAHLGEESPLRGWRGSGTIFFNRCNLRCQYCQNHAISQTDSGDELEPEEIAEIMLSLQTAGCHNINFVSPSHVVPQILAAVLIAAQAGLHIPLVYNTGGYDSRAMLHLLGGVIDIYMPDMKYSEARLAQHYSKVRNYPQINQAAVREMHRQVGDLVVNEQGLAVRGLLIRHLVLPNDLAGTADIVRFLAEEISNKTYINLMDQYRPDYNAHQFPELDRRVTREEYIQAVKQAHSVGLNRLDRSPSHLW